MKFACGSYKSETKFNTGDIVYLIHDPEQCERMITGIVVRFGHYIYMVSCAEEETEHYENELSETIKVV